MTTHSPSSLGAFQNCERRYYFKYVRQLPSVPNSAMRRGTLVHEWIERYINGERDGHTGGSGVTKEDKEDSISGIFEEEERLKEASMDTADKNLNGIEFVTTYSDRTTLTGASVKYSIENFDEKQQQKIKDFLAPLFKKDYHFSAEVKVAIDRKKERVDFDDTFYGYLRGVMDLVVVDVPAKSGIVVDWKTGRSTVTSWQMSVYAVLLHHLLPDYGFRFYYFYTDRTRAESVKEVEMSDILAVEKEIDGLIERIESKKGIEEDFTPCPSWMCKSCDYRGYCPHGEFLAVKEEVRLPDSMVLSKDSLGCAGFLGDLLNAD